MSPTKAFDFTDQVAIVTGAGSRMPGTGPLSFLFSLHLPGLLSMTNNIVGEIGNGRATAILLARQGAKVALVDYNSEWAQETERMIDLEGGKSAVVQADVTDEESCRRAVAQTVEIFGAVNILVNIGKTPWNNLSAQTLKIIPISWSWRCHGRRCKA